MGGTHGKEKHGERSQTEKKKKNKKEGNAPGDGKDEYVKFIMREQLRREKEFREKQTEKDNIYNHVTQKIKKESNLQQTLSLQPGFTTTNTSPVTDSSFYSQSRPSMNTLVSSPTSLEAQMVEEGKDRSVKGGIGQFKFMASALKKQQSQHEPTTSQSVSMDNILMPSQQQQLHSLRHQQSANNILGSTASGDKLNNNPLNSIHSGGSGGSGGNGRGGLGNNSMAFKIERVIESTGSGSNSIALSPLAPLGSISNGSQTSRNNNTQGGQSSKKDMEWVNMLLLDLKRVASDKEFAQHLINVLAQWVEKGKSKLDPKEFRTMYINKNFSNTDSSASLSAQALQKNKQRQISIQMGVLANQSFTSPSPLNQGLKNSAMGPSNNSSMIQDFSQALFVNPLDLINEQQQQTSDAHYQIDLIGLSFYRCSDQYKRKFITLHQHFQFEHHPLRKIMDEFRRWLLDTYIKEKMLQIKQAANFFEKERIETIVRQEVEKLLDVVVDYQQEFVDILVRATVVFYQLDIKSGETSEVLLHNLLTSMILKNPVYSRVMELFRTTYKEQVTALEQQIEALQPERQKLNQVLGISDIQIGEYILERAEQQLNMQLLNQSLNTSGINTMPAQGGGAGVFHQNLAQVREEQQEEDDSQNESSQSSSQYEKRRNKNGEKRKPKMDAQRQKECIEAFDKTLSKISRVRMFSSPTAKIEYISKFLNGIMPDDGLQEADWVVSLMILAFVSIGKKAAELYTEMRYIKSFSSEDLFEKIGEGQSLAQIETAMEKIMGGVQHLLGDAQQGISQHSQSNTSQTFSRKRSDDLTSSHSDKGLDKSKGHSSHRNHSISAATSPPNGIFRRQNTQGEKPAVKKSAGDLGVPINIGEPSYMKMFMTQKSARGLKKNDANMEFDNSQDSREEEEVKQTAVFKIDTEHGNALESNALAHSPSIPKPSYVGDEDDDDLNKDRQTLANIRKERAETWQLDQEEHEAKKRAQYNIAITNFNHFNFQQQQQTTEPMQSLAQGGIQTEEPQIDENEQQDGFFRKLMSSAQIRGELPPKEDLEKMIMTTTGSIFQHLLDEQEVELRVQQEKPQVELLDSQEKEFYESLINKKQ